MNQWIIGNDILPLVATSSKYKHRFCYKYLQEYIDKDRTYYLCALYGLQGTGKTTLMYHTMYELLTQKCTDKVAYISFGTNTDYTDVDLVADIEELKNRGIEYVFIDEITAIKMDLEDNSLNVLADRYAVRGMKIVVTGDYSYAIKLLEEDVLFDRIEKIDTNYFSYKEAREVLGYDIETFIKYGGIINPTVKTMYFPEKYIRELIVENVSSSLIRSQSIYDYFPNYNVDSKEQFQSKIENEIEQYIDQFLRQILYKKLARDGFDIPKIEFDREVADKVLNIFRKLKLITDVSYCSGIDRYFTSYYLRYHLCTRFLEEIRETIVDDTMRSAFESRIDELVKSDILESVVCMDIYKSLKYKCDKYRSDDGRENLIIDDGDHINIYEIACSTQIVSDQTRRLLDVEFMQELEKEYNKPVKDRVILYMGEMASARMTCDSASSEGLSIKYENVEEFLCEGI